MPNPSDMLKQPWASAAIMQAALKEVELLADRVREKSVRDYETLAQQLLDISHRDIRPVLDAVAGVAPALTKLLDKKR